MNTKLSNAAWTLLAASALLTSPLLRAQVPNPTQKNVTVETLDPTPIFRIEVVQRNTPAVNYLHRSGATRVDFSGTPLLANGSGNAKVESERGVIKINAEFKNFASPQSFGPEYLTYVLWAISPDGRPVNLGELTLDDYGNGSHSKIDTTSEIQTFGMIVTAEPYYAVTQPSDVVVMENVVRPDTRGVVETINAKYELLPRGSYTSQGKAKGFIPIKVSKKDPFELYEAENAVQLARVAAADRYAADSFNKAVDSLNQALKYQAQKPGQKPVITMAREAAVRAEDSRHLALLRAKDEAERNERAAALAREQAERARADAARQNAEQARLNAEQANLQANQSRLRAEDEARQRAEADRQRAEADRNRAEAERNRAAAESERVAAERAKSEAEIARASAETARASAEAAKLQSEQARQQAEAARQAALAEQQRLAGEADRAHREVAEAEQEKAKLRQQLMVQLNQILQTSDSARGLIVNMSDVLFDVDQYTLKPGAREKLAKISGIVLAHPGLKLEVEGHTDSTGSDQYNQKLSENRAGAVRTYLVAQGLNSGSITSQGFGKTRPVADNNTAAGRQVNRRVELVVSGEILGTTVTGRTTTSVTRPAAQ